MKINIAQSPPKYRVLRKESYSCENVWLIKAAFEHENALETKNGEFLSFKNHLTSNPAGKHSEISNNGHFHEKLVSRRLFKWLRSLFIKQGPSLSLILPNLTVDTLKYKSLKFHHFCTKMHFYKESFFGWGYQKCKLSIFKIFEVNHL